jgi:hypothetical protein
VNEHNLANTFSETAAPAQVEVARLRTLGWEEFVWMLILSGLATLWIMLLMSPSWR